MASKRIVYLDLVKLFTIYLVILGHVIAMMVNGYAVGGKLYAFIYSFHMPLFMLLSGYFVSSRLGEVPIKELIWKKGQQLLLPTLTCTIICCIYLGLTKDNPNYRDEIIGNSWFLKILFVYYMLFALLKRLPVNDWLLFAGSCTALFLIPGCSALQLNLLFPYFWGGRLLRKYQILERINYSWQYPVAFILIYGITYSFQQYWGIPNYLEINCSSLKNDLYIILFRYIVAFSGSMSVISVIAMIYKHFEECHFVNHLSRFGRWTLGIYVLQTILVINIFPNTFTFYVESEVVFDTFIAPMLAIGFLTMCLCLIQWLSNNMIADLLLFGGQYNIKL